MFDMTIDAVLVFFRELKIRNEYLFYLGIFCFIFSIACIIFTQTTTTKVHEINAWYKPFKFTVSIGMYSWTMAWLCHYLHNFNVILFSWAVILLLGFELIYIAFQASRGELSHFNFNAPIYTVMYSLMGIAAVLITIYTAYIGFLFFTQSFPNLPPYYLWAIRMGIIIFVIFSFEGALMSSRASHSVGAINDNSNLLIVGWSKTVGDLRVAHFIGMHALQILPLLSFYILKNTKTTIILAVLYGLLATSTLVQALNGQPVITQEGQQKNIE
jgi:hypothetical protein